MSFNQIFVWLHVLSDDLLVIRVGAAIGIGFSAKDSTLRAGDTRGEGSLVSSLLATLRAHGHITVNVNPVVRPFLESGFSPGAQKIVGAVPAYAEAIVFERSVDFAEGWSNPRDRGVAGDAAPAAVHDVCRSGAWNLIFQIGISRM